MATKTTKGAQIISDAEAKVNADAETVRAELADIAIALPLYEQRARDIADEVGAAHEIKARWRKGEDVPALDYAVAKAEDEKATYLSKALSRRRTALTAQLPAGTN